ncbi:LppC putative lipoprotein [hydrothermal vent metagenome]|uniref:LppC putative lipoprotein n=1 Tax=hydrothermal vent metagenome TaxID=652676 RepID=A0A3B0X9L9_9ZZZZ
MTALTRITARLIISLTLLLSFYGCTPKDSVISDSDTSLTGEARGDTEDEFQESADKYIEMALSSTGFPRNQHLLKATQILTSQNQFERAGKQLAAINNEILSPETTLEIRLLSAEISIGLGNSREALKQLNTDRVLPAPQQIRLMQLRARAFLDAGYPLESAKTRVQMDKLLITDPFEQQLNHQAIWEALSLLPQTSLQQISNAPLNNELLGWIELAKVAKQAQVDWQFLQDGIYLWREEYPNHPAAKIFIKELGNKQIELVEKPKHIAVLLPLRGQYAQIAAAISAGILSSYYQNPDKNTRPRISFIDTSSNPMATWNYYKEAADAGADFIIGPFLKPAVDNLTRATQVEIPTLTLNYSSIQSNISTNLFQFGLLPEDEARQAAEMAFRQGRTHAAVLVPEGKWGERLRNAFQQRFEELGGIVVSAKTYMPNKNDFKRPIQNMLNISQSYARYRNVRNTIRNSVKFTPYRRQDVDMIFMIATPNDARQLKPQFKFHYAGDLPVYSTSHAYKGKLDLQADRDIDELNFCDMPWILNPPNKFKQSLLDYWPEQQQYTRLFALGVDAYNVIPFLGRLQGKAYDRFSGQTGNLYLDPLNRVHRELLWAQFNKGKPELVDISALPINYILDETQPAHQPLQ